MTALAGLRVIEMASIGPGPFCAMMLADMGAEIIRIERPQGQSFQDPVMTRGRQSMSLDLRDADNVQRLKRLIAKADVLIEGFRPGVMERMGLSPEVCLELNPRLVYGRMTGWGQTGPLSLTAGHDINYIGLTGVLHAVGREGDVPVPPLNYVGDFGGGAMMLLSGILAALYERNQSGLGQVIDAAMTDGSALLSALMHGMRALGQWNNPRGQNMLDTGAHFYEVYECADGKFLAVGAIEAPFYEDLRNLAGLQDPLFEQQLNARAWPELKQKMRMIFKSKSQSEWMAVFQGSDACVTPVLDWEEAVANPHNQARNTFQTIAGVVHPSPAPRLSRTPSSISHGVSVEELECAWLASN